MVKLQISDYIMEYIADKGVQHIFGFPGGSIVCLLDAITLNPQLQYIGMHHEQSVAYAAEGYARVKNSPGVALASNGPGAVNLLGGIASAYCDSIPVLYLTGQANTFDLKGAKKVRQLAFQEIDIVSIAKPITKYCEMVTNPDDIKYFLDKSFYEMTTGRKGPVLLDIPINIQRSHVEPLKLQGFIPDDRKQMQKDSNIKDAINLLEQSKRPVFLVGGGIRLSDSNDTLNKLIRHFQIPVVYTLMGKDSVVGNYEYNCGLIGMYGTRYGNMCLANSDLIISLGARLDKRQTGKNVKAFAKQAKLIRVDIDRNELNNKVKYDELAYEMNVREFINELLCSDAKTLNLSNWQKEVLKYKYLLETEQIIPYKNPKQNPNYIVRKISETICADAIVVSDVGQNQMWVAQSATDDNKRRYLFAGGFGSMGCSLPMSIGSYFAEPYSQIVSFNGDGGFQMNIQELQTIVRYKIPVKIIVLQNNCLGMIRVMQEAYFNERYTGTKNGFDNPDFNSVSSAYGIDSYLCKNVYEFVDVFEKSDKAVPQVYVLILEQDTDVVPKPSEGRPLEDAEPLISRELFEALTNYRY